MKNRIASNSASLFIETGDAFYKNPIVGVLRFLPLAQDASFSINTQSNRAKLSEIGNKRNIGASYQLVPEPEFSFSYYTSNFLIEEGFGFYKDVNGVNNTLDFTDNSKPFSGDASFNVYFLTTEEEGEDVLGNIPDVGYPTGNFSGYYSIGFGNCQISSFGLSAAVGNLPVVSVGGNAAHSSIEQLSSGYISLPSIDLTGGNADDAGSGIIALESFVGFTGVDVIKPGGIDMQVTAPWQIGGPDIASLCVQSFDLSIDLSRKSLVGFGNHFVQGRELSYPINGSLSLNSITTDFDSGNLSGLISGLALGAGSSVTITMTTLDDKTGTIVLGSEDFPLTLDNINYNIGINGNLSADIVYSFDIA
jgi:hypothetical protein